MRHLFKRVAFVAASAAVMSTQSARLPRRTIGSMIAVTVAASAIGLLGAAPAPAAVDNVVMKWNTALLQGIRESTIGPP